MRQQSLTKSSAPDRNKGRRRRRHAAPAIGAGQSTVIQPAAQKPGIAITPLRGFFISLMFLAPMAALGTLCFALVQNNLRLHQKNDKLTGMASEVRAEIDTLSEEIEALRARAGVAEVTESAEPSEPTSKVKMSESDPVGAPPSGLKLNHSSTINPSQDERQSESLPPRGGIAGRIDALDLLKDAKAQVPKLNKALDLAAEPLEETLAAEAAYPDGLPMPGHLEVSSEFGVRDNPFGGSSYEVHEGIDFVGAVGDIVAATGEGKITLAGPNGGYGNSVTIDHGYGYETLYAHMSKVKVKVGDRVKRGQIIGHVGSTGRSSGPHLHYSIYKDEKAINPRKLMNIPENILAASPR